MYCKVCSSSLPCTSLFEHTHTHTHTTTTKEHPLGGISQISVALYPIYTGTTLRLISLVEISPELQNLKSNCLPPYISTWTFKRHLKFNTPKPKYCSFPKNCICSQSHFSLSQLHPSISWARYLDFSSRCHCHILYFHDGSNSSHLSPPHHPSQLHHHVSPGVL